MIIAEINQGPKATYSLQGKVLTIGGQVSIDLQERQSDVQKVIDICLDNQLQTMREGIGAWYVATIIIPPKQRELVPSGDEKGNDIYIERDRELDINKVELRLWALPAGYGQNESTEQGVTE